MKEIEYLGNKDLLQLPKIAFLASNTVSSEVVLKCYDWATEMCRQGRCVISGFSSKMEKDVLHFLLKGESPIIMVLARRMYKTIPAELKEAFEHNRLLIISTSSAARQSRATARVRNDCVCKLADSVLLVGAMEGNSLFPLKDSYKDKIEFL